MLFNGFSFDLNDMCFPSPHNFFSQADHAFIPISSDIVALRYGYFEPYLLDKIVKDEYGADKAISYPKYRIELTLEEARQMRFWDYYENKNAPDSERWGQGLIRYLNDDLSAKIIYDMIEIIKKRNNNSVSLTNAEEFLNKYLKIIGRTIDEIA